LGDVNNMPNEKTEAAQNSEINLDELRRQFDTEARYRDLLGWQGILITAIAVAMSLFHFYTSGFGLLLAMKQGSLHLAFVLVLVFLLYPARETSRRDGIPLYDFILAALAAFATLYIFFEFEDLVNRAGLPTTMDIIVGFMGIILLLEATRRVSSPVLPCIASFQVHVSRPFKFRSCF
jgi:TRAP-type uncharacterized transport system fused permease subunit